MNVVRRGPLGIRRLGYGCFSLGILLLVGIVCPAPLAGASATLPGIAAQFALGTNTGNLAPAPSLTFPGISPANSNPPDSHGAVGPNHVVTHTNNAARIQDRNGNVLASTGIRNFWSGLGVTDVFDPKVIYEPYVNRFVAVACAQRRSSASGMLFGISETSDPTGNWRLWLLDGDSTNKDWVDYPNIGFTADRISFTANMFTIADDTFVGINLWTIDTASAAGTGSLNFQLQRIGNAGGSLAPAMTYDPAITTQYIIRTGSANIFGTGRLSLYNNSGTVGSLSFSTSPTSPIGKPWSISVPNAKQLGTTSLIETNDSRLHNVVIRNGNLWTVHTVALDTTIRDHAAIHWWQINPINGSTVVDGFIEDVDANGHFNIDTGKHYYFPSIAVNKDNEVLIGFTGSSGLEYASNYYTYRAPSYPPGLFDIPLRYQAGVGTFTGSRWGDYSHTVVDPVDDTTLWTVQQYASGSNTGGNSWAKVGQSTADTTPPQVSSAAAANEVTVRVTFSEPMANNAALVNPAFYTFSGGLTAAGVTRINSTQVDVAVNEMNNGTGYTVTVSTSGPTDSAGNTVSGSANSATFTGLGVSPTVTITQVTGNPTNANTVVYSVVFSEPVGNSFTAADVAVSGSLASGATVSVTGTDPNYSVSITPADPNAEGTLSITIGTGVTDLAGNTFAGASAPASFTIDNTPPVITVNTLTTNDRTPPLTGNVNDSTAAISIAVGGQTRTATNNGNGTWTLPDNTISPGLADGTYNVVATATDPAGNVGTDGTTNELTIDATPPIITVNALITNDNTPPLTGSVNDPTATISIAVGGQTRPATNNGNGTWTLPDGSLSALADGTYNVVATAIDPIGNVGTDGTTNELTIDTVAPVVTVNLLITNDTRPPLSGTVSDLSAPVTVSVGGQTHTATNNGNGTWTLADNTINPALAQGTYNVNASATDAAGNTGTDNTSNELTIDTTPPIVTVTPKTTNDTTPSLAGTINDAGATLSLTVGGQTRTPVNNGNGTWTLPNNSLNPLAQGTYNVAVTATDAAGNSATDSTTNELVIDTTPPIITVTALAGPTNDNTPPLSGTVNDATASISITVGGQTRPATNHGTTWSLANGALSPLPDGTYDVIARATDPAGNVGTDTTTNELTIDTVAPVITVNTLATNDNTPPLSGTVNDPTAAIMVTVNGVTRNATNNGNGTWTLADNALPALPDGTYNVVATATDAAGNTGTDNTTNELTIDTVAPVITVNTLVTNDNRPPLTGTVNDNTAAISIAVGGQTRTATNNGNGTWTLADNAINPALPDGTYNVTATATDAVGNAGTDGTTNELTIDTAAPVITVNTLITNDTTPPLSGTVNEPGAAITIAVGGQNRTATNNGNGTWTLANNSLAALAEGTYSVTATATDAAGNVGTDNTSNELTIDTTPPAITVTAKITNNTSPSLDGTVNDPAATISVVVSGQTRAAVNNGNGTWTLPAGSLNPLGQGVFSVTARATDAAGNVGTDPTSNELTIDTTPPSVTVNTLATTDTSPALTGTVSEAGASVAISVAGQNNLPAINNGNGTWTLPANTLAPLADGTYDVAATATDAAGNIGTDGTTGELTINNTPPAITVNSLNTNATRPQLTGTVNDPAAAITIAVGGQTGLAANNNGNGTWTLPANTINPPLPEGTYDVTATATDALGNVGTDATTDELVVDTTPPTVTVDALLTMDTRPPLTGTVNDPAAAISVAVGGQTRTAVNNGNGTWTLPDNAINPALAEGTYNVTVTATDLAGNSATDPTSGELTIDTTPPTVTVNPLTTSDNRPPLTGAVNDTTATLSVSVGGQTHPATNNGNGTWTLADNTINPALADGTYSVTVTATDPAGNAATDGTANELVIDTVAPTVTVDPLTTADNRPPLTGTVSEPGATVRVVVSGQTNTATNNGDGTWTLADNVLTALPDGTYNVSATATDAAGNVGTDNTNNELVIDTTAPTVTVNTLVTNNPRPQLTGTTNDNSATITVSVGGQTGLAATNNGNGTWTLPAGTINPGLPDGTYNVAATATDPLGNARTDSTTNELRIDTTLNVTVNTLTTSDTSPALSGTIDDNTATLTVTVDGSTYAGVNNGNGTWTLPGNTIAPPLANGTYDVDVAAEDSLGNTATDNTTGELVIDATAPVITVDTLITADTRPELTGTVSSAAATITVDVGGQTGLAAANNGDGTWTLAQNTIDPGLADGVYNVIARATDGGTGTDNTTNELTIDTVAPTTTVNSLVTNDQRSALSGTVSEPGATLTLDVGGQLGLAAVNNGNGTWTLAAGVIDPALAEGVYDVTVNATDLAGNADNTTTPGALTIDLTAPVITVDALLTGDTTPPLTGTVDDNSATIRVDVGGQTNLAAANNGDGTWTLPDNTINPALPGGTYSVTARATDAAGNVGTDATANELTIDTTPPAITVNALATTDNRPELTGSIDDATASISISVGGQTHPATNNGDGTWTLPDNTINPGLADGVYNVAATATDPQGNVGTDNTSNELRIDTTPPVVTVNALTTNDNRPRLTGTVNDISATIAISVGGQNHTATNNGNGTWTLARNTINPGLADGTYDVMATATDTLGNAASDGTANELTILTAAPVITVTPLITNDTRPPLSGTVNDNAAAISVSVAGQTHAAVNNGDGTWTLPDNTITPALAQGTYNVTATATNAAGVVGTDNTNNELTIDTTAPTVTVNTLFTQDATPPLGGSVNDPTAAISVEVGGQTHPAVNNGNGTWTLPDNTINPALAEGSYNVVVRATDAAGNVGTDNTNNELHVDTTPPTVTVDNLATMDNSPGLTGTVSDNIAAGTITLSVTVDGQTVPALRSGGNWFVLNGLLTPLADGTYDVSVTATDAAGNVGTDNTVDELLIDTTAPIVTVDALQTNDPTPPLSGTVDDPAAAIAVSVGGQSNIPAANNGDGTWSLADNTLAPLPDGTYNVQVTATDSVGNVGTDNTADELLIDATAPVVTVHALVTNDSTPPLTGTVDDPTAGIAVTVGGNGYAAANNGDGTWTLPDNTIAPPLADGTYDVSVTATDGLGNVGTDNTAGELQIDLVAPVITVDVFLTNNNTPPLTGTVDDPTAAITIEVGGQSNLPATNNGDGTWRLPSGTLSPLADGVYDVIARATDPAGNVGTDATAGELTVNTQAPTITVDILITSDNTPPLTGTVNDPGATVTISVGGQNNLPATNNGDGTWTLPNNTLAPLADGIYNVLAQARDAQNNVSNDATQGELRIDTTPPVVTVNALLTNNNRPALTGTVNEPDATVTIAVGGQTGLAATNNGDGTWTLPANTLSALADNAAGYDVAATAVDPAGNIGTDNTTGELRIDTVAPAITVNALTTAEASPQLTGAVDDTMATIQVTVNGQTLAATNNSNGTWTLPGGRLNALASGTYSVAATATDAAGNIGADNTDNELVVDRTPPVVTVDVLITTDTTPPLSGTVDDPTAVITIRVAGTNYMATNNGDGTWTLPDNTISPPLADGRYDVRATAADTLGNVGTDATNGELTVDTVGPAVTVNVLVTNDTTPPLTGTVSEPGVAVMVTVAGNTYAATNNDDGTWTLPDNTISPPLAEGDYNVGVVATDSLGNVGVDTTADELRIDVTPPVITVTPRLTNQASPALAGTVNDPTAAIRIEVDGTTYTATNIGNGNWALVAGLISPLASGVYDVAAQATDPAGNVATDGTLNELTVDVDVPVITVDQLTTADNTPPLTGTIDDPNATIVVTVAGQTNPATNNGDGTWTLADNILTPLPDGAYNVIAVATDLAGNAGTDPTLVDDLFIITAAPAITVNPLSTPDTSPQINGTVNQTTSSIQVTVDGQTLDAVNNGDGTWTLPPNTLAPLSEGTYDVVARATDLLGNTGTDDTTDELTLDLSLPLLTVNPLRTRDRTPPLTGTISQNGVAISVTVGGQTLPAVNNDDGTWTLPDNSLNPLDHGTYDVAVTANGANDTTINELVIDTIGPAIQLSGPSVAVTKSGPVSFNVHYEDAAFVGLADTNIELFALLDADPAVLGAPQAPTAKTFPITVPTADGVATISGTGNTLRTITITDMVGDGYLGVAIVAGSAIDSVGNPSPSTISTDLVFVDNSPPGILSLAVVDFGIADVRFNEAMGASALNPENYTLSGPGRGTLAARPDGVAQVEPDRFRLTWNAGGLSNGGMVTITVFNVTDIVDNLIGETNSATTFVEGIGVSPTVANVSVREARAVSVQFSEPIPVGALNALNYTVSGSGRGTLAPNPTNVAEMPLNDPEDPDVILTGLRNTYLLTWAEGEMLQGGDITVTVSGVQDSAGNALVSPDSGTDPGAGIGIPPRLDTVRAVTGLTVSAAFDEAMGAGADDPANYALSGAGRGTLAAQPDSVTPTGTGTYLLTWNGGEMLNGGDITITATGVADAAGNAIGADNTATHRNAGRDGLITVNIPARQDTTLYEDGDGALANGAGATLFAGTSADGLIRRGLLLFDVAGNIPQGSLVRDAELRLFASGADGNPAARTLGVHAVAAEWSEGGADAGEPGAEGAPAESGEATWLHRDFDTELWATPGGDFVTPARATASVAGPGIYTWTSGGVLDDTQAWLDDLGTNFGWLLAGDETGPGTAKAFRTDEHNALAERPQLRVVFSLNGGPGGPTLGTIGDQEIAEGQTLALDLTAADTDGNPLIISAALTSLPPGNSASLTDNGDGTAQFQWTPTFVDAGEYVVTFIATQSGVADPLSISESVLIAVANVNQAPALAEFAPQTATEGQPFTFTAEVFDGDPGDTHTFALVLPIDGVEIDSATGTLTWTPGFSDAGDYSIGIRVTDDGQPPLSDTRTLPVTVIDANGPPAILPVGDQVVVEAETLSFLVRATDPDLDDTLTFSLENSPARSTIDPDTGFFRWTPNITEAGEHQVTVVVTDDGDPAMSASETFNVTVIDDNRHPTGIALTPASVPENMPAGTVVGTLTTVDPDAADVHTYTLVAGAGDTDNGLFSIEGDRVLTNVSFNFEARATYSIRVHTFDGKDGEFARAITISIINRNDPPTAIALSNTSVSENAPIGTAVGTFTTTDEDVADTHVYTLVSGEGDTDNGLFAIAGDALVVNGVLDFDTQESHSVRVRSEDSGGGFVEGIFIITLVDEINLPDGIVLSDSRVPENEPAGTEVGQFMTVGGGEGHVYSLVSGAGSGDNGDFAIDGDILRTSRPLDFEAKRMRSIRVRSVDDLQSAIESVFEIEVLDRNDPPTDIFIGAAGILGNVPADTLIGTLTTVDQDAVDSHTYALAGGEGDGDNDFFRVDGDQLFTDRAIDFGAKDTFRLRLRSTDAAGAFFEKAFELINDDVDGDGLSDAWELFHFGNLLSSGEDDNDGDGLTNLEEFRLGTNPTLWDTDGDGVSDGDEVALGTDPLNSADAPAVLEVTPDSMVLGREAGRATFRVRNRGLSPLNWRAEIVSGGFAEITAGASGTNAGEIEVALSANLSSAGRTATLRISAARTVGSPLDIPLNQTACSAPGVPHDVLATNGTLPGVVRVLWDAVADADQYMVYRSLGTDPNAADLIATVVGTAYTDTTAEFLSGKQAAGGGCLPVIDPGPSAPEYQYWVRAMNACGTSAFSAPDGGFPGAGQPPATPLFEPVLPAFEAEGRALRARADSVLAIRLKHATAINPDSIRGEVERDSGIDTAVAWQAIDTAGLKDGWALYLPGDEPFSAGESVTFTVRAFTVAGESIGPLSYNFTVETEGEFLDRIGAGAEPVGQPAYMDFDTTGIDLSRESQDEIAVYAIAGGALPSAPANAAGPAYAIVPDEAYGLLQRVWLPLPEGLRAGDVAVNYFFVDKTGSRSGWYAAGNIAGWSNESSYLELELDGTRYIGFTVRHGALVQLVAANAKGAEQAGASAFPTPLVRFGGDGIVLILLLFGLTIVSVRMGGRRAGRGLQP